MNALRRGCGLRRSGVLLAAVGAALVAVLGGATVAPGRADTGPVLPVQIVPLPKSVTPIAGETFTLAAGARIVVAKGADSALPVANDLAAILRPSTGYALPVMSKGPAKPGDISLGLSGASSLGSEGYQLDVTAGGVQLQATAPAGLFYGVQTLRQLLPVWIESSTLQPGPWTMPGVHITDTPRYPYRGMMFDIARHYEPPSAVERLIDEISRFKLNVLHLHMSDDQGFRIVINGRPELTDIGGQYSINNDPGGYWTQAQYMDVVNYAAAHFMTIVPEVDSPGHTSAIIKSYTTGGTNPATGQPYPVFPDINCNGTLCPESPNTWAILTDIITQLSAMSSSPYYDMGGDEVTNISQDRYNAFLNQEAGIVRSVGKAPMGWADISSAAFTPSDSPVGIAQFWADGDLTTSAADTGRAAVAKGMKVIMTPSDYSYLDMKYNRSSPFGQTWSGYLDVSNFYNWSGSSSDPAVTIPARTQSGTTSAPAAPGATNVKVASVSGFIPFTPLTIDTGGNLETVNVTAVGTAQASQGGQRHQS
jgi:hexosaminidase